MSIAAVFTAGVNSSVMAFDSTNNEPEHDPVDMNVQGVNQGSNTPIAVLKPAEILVQYCKSSNQKADNGSGYCKENEQKFQGCSAGYVGDHTMIKGVAHPPEPATEDLIVNAASRINGTFGGGALTRKGDALIFPLFTAGQRKVDAQKPLLEEITCDKTDGLKLPESEPNKEGWSTEFVVRNTDTKHAIVAKVAFRSKIDSEEILDFNVYLSAYDVVRFKIEKVTVDGKLVTRVISTDGSVPYFASKPENGRDLDQVVFASEDRPFVRDMPEDIGYAIVYGMGQAKNRDSQTSQHDLRYDHEHQQLFENYREELDVCRPNWRKGHRNAMAIGTYIPFERNATNMPFYIPSPNRPTTCAGVDTSNSHYPDLPGNLFGDVDPVLTGTVRIYNADKDNNNANPRDMLLPATAVENFTTPNNKILYVEGEIASLQDRRIHGATLAPVLPRTCHSNNADDLFSHNISYPNPIDWAYYDEAGIQRDANPFLVKQTVYKFAKLPDNVKNTLIVTQPYKRILVQTGNDDYYWKSFECDAGKPDSNAIDGVNNYGGLIMRYVIFDEDEHRTAKVYDHSPFGHNEGSWPYEVQAFSDLEKSITIDRYTDQNTGRVTTVLREMTSEEIAEQTAGTKDYSFNGFGLVTLIGNEGSPLSSNPGNNGGWGVPAIVTQMVATNVGGKGQLNWIYSETK